MDNLSKPVPLWIEEIMEGQWQQLEHVQIIYI